MIKVGASDVACQAGTIPGYFDFERPGWPLRRMDENVVEIELCVRRRKEMV